MTVAEEIRAELARQKKTVSGLAGDLGIKKQTLSRKIGTEKTQLTVSDLTAIGAVLGVDGSEFMRRSEARAEQQERNAS